MLCILLLCAAVSLGCAERKIPDVLRVSQEIVSERKDHFRIVTHSVLHSAREDVNEAINARVAALTEEAMPLVPQGRDYRSRTARADICTQITRTGERWMSFHICAQISASNNQTWVRSEDYTYEMETGRLIRLGEIIAGEGWETLLREIRTQLENFFPENTPDRDALDRICSREKLADAGFVMTPGHMALYFPAAEVYPDHPEALLRAEIYVPQLWEILTEEARRETDCTGYALVALTYDDGPAKGRTRDVLNATVCHPAQVTFFPIGSRLVKNAELIHREFDGGHSVQSHTWAHAHEKKNVNAKKTAEWETQFNRTIGCIIGAIPVMMRPPGGRWNLYADAGCEMPMILWSKNGLDASVGDSRKDMMKCLASALGARDGDIVLFHDVKDFAGEMAERCLKRFEEKNILLVTVNDLCALRGIPLEPGTVLESCPPAPAE